MANSNFHCCCLLWRSGISTDSQEEPSSFVLLEGHSYVLRRPALIGSQTWLGTVQNNMPLFRKGLYRAHVQKLILAHLGCFFPPLFYFWHIFLTVYCVLWEHRHFLFVLYSSSVCRLWSWSSLVRPGQQALFSSQLACQVLPRKKTYVCGFLVIAWECDWICT